MFRPSNRTWATTIPPSLQSNSVGPEGDIAQAPKASKALSQTISKTANRQRDQRRLYVLNGGSDCSVLVGFGNAIQGSGDCSRSDSGIRKDSSQNPLWRSQKWLW